MQQMCYTGVTMPHDEQTDPVYLTTAQAAERLGVTRQRVHQLIKDGRLPASRFGRAHMIREEDLDLVEDRKKKPGRPRKSLDNS